MMIKKKIKKSPFGDVLVFLQRTTTISACLLFVKAAEPSYAAVFPLRLLTPCFSLPGVYVAHVLSTSCLCCSVLIQDLFYISCLCCSVQGRFFLTFLSFLLDLSVLGIRVFSASSLSLALRITSLPAVYCRTPAFSPVFLW